MLFWLSTSPPVCRFTRLRATCREPLSRGCAEQYGPNFAAAVHRLDRETSGVMLCARDRSVAKILANDFAARDVQKEYWAICEGAGPGSPHAAATWPGLVVDAPIASGGARIRIGVRIDPLLGKPATTRLLCVGSFYRGDEAFSLWRAWPHTGRRHQVRIHLRHAGWPIVGRQPMAPTTASMSNLPTAPSTWPVGGPCASGAEALHAACLDVRHPVSGERLRLASPWPPDFAGFYCGAPLATVHGPLECDSRAHALMA